MDTTEWRIIRQLLDLRKKFKDDPLGNYPYVMPWDSHLNQDVHACHDQYKFLTANLNDDDKKKFDGNTPNIISSSYTRLFNPDTGCVPSPKKITQDVDRFLLPLKSLRESRGAIIIYSCLQSGRRQKRIKKKNPNGESIREKKI